MESWKVRSLIFFLSSPILLFGCATAPTPPSQIAASGAEEAPPENFEQWWARNEAAALELDAQWEAAEALREETVRRAREQLEKDRERIERLQAEEEWHADQIAQRESDLERLRDLERSARVPEGLQEDLENAEKQLADARSEAAKLRGETEELQESVARREGFDDDEFFAEANRDLLRNMLELERDFQAEAVRYARTEMAGDPQARVVVDRLEMRLRDVKMSLSTGAADPGFAAQTPRMILNTGSFMEALFRTHVTQTRFPLSGNELQTVDPKEREDLRRLAAGLGEKFPEFYVYIDGHADKNRFKEDTACVSATKNYELSRDRAEAAKNFLVEVLGHEERIFIDWYGNFAELAEGDDEDDRRIELRVTTRLAEDGDPSDSSHAAYLNLRRREEGFALAGRQFVREPGVWIEYPCVGKHAARTVEYLSRDYEDLIDRLSMDVDLPFDVDLGSGHVLDIRLGAAFVVEDPDMGCTKVVPCPIP